VNERSDAICNPVTAISFIHYGAVIHYGTVHSLHVLFADAFIH
jgi:hypothetical protein